jgi:murein tripeptide amidase MpaA
VFPDVNPDGKNYSQTRDVWWRKNRNPNTTAGHHTTPGVDLNRNFDFLWDSGIGTSSNPTNPVYKGESAFSEPETCNVRHLLDTYQDIGYFVDIHSYGRLIMYSWGDDNNQTTNPEQNFTNTEYNGKRGTVDDTLMENLSPPRTRKRLKTSLAR